MVKMTSAYASKLLKKLTDERNYWTNIEKDRYTYFVEDGEEPLIPDYDYQQVKEKIAGLNHKIIKVRHAINLSNTTSVIRIGDTDYTIDEILVSMPQLNARKDILDEMRKHQPKQRAEGRHRRFYSESPAEYEIANYNVEDARADYDRVSSEIMEMQLALDRHNQTHEFEVEIEL